MQTLTLAQPLQTQEPQVMLDAGLAPGRYQVQLVVEGPSGRSAPALITLTIGPSPNLRPARVPAAPKTPRKPPAG